MKIHHVCINVSDMDESLKLYRDFLGFHCFKDTVIPDGKNFDQQTLDDIFHVKGAKSRMAILVCKETGTMLELEQAIVPKIQKVPKEQLQYGYVGFSEVAFEITGIETWLEKVKAAGYETQTEYVWSSANLVKSFLFYDPDGNMVQMVEKLR
jgi:catechol 2,3-dioxygenase-like lactoylglutathione lyase family enzyme